MWVVFGGGFGGKFWRVFLAGGVAAPPPAERAGKNGIFLPFFAKIGVFFVIFCGNLLEN